MWCTFFTLIMLLFFTLIMLVFIEVSALPSSFSDSNICWLLDEFPQSYDDEPLSGMNYIRHDNRSLSENWSGLGLDHDGLDLAVKLFDILPKREEQDYYN